jgi:hypothetical protein
MYERKRLATTRSFTHDLDVRLIFQQDADIPTR